MPFQDLVKLWWTWNEPVNCEFGASYIIKHCCIGTVLVTTAMVGPVSSRFHSNCMVHGFDSGFEKRRVHCLN